MTRKRWKISKANKAQAGALAAAAELPPVATLLALNRGVEDGEELLQFLGLEGGAQTNPYDLPDMELAVERVERALEKGEHITVFGDYDCDGVCATALLYQYLSTRTKALSHYLPDRQKEGYGLNMAAVDVLHERGTKLIITVDNGVSAIREIEHARALGMDAVITDHHQMGERLPACAAVVNPHRREAEKLPFREFAGVGVAFLLVCALEGSEPEELLPAFGDLLALGTVADVVPLLGENRAFVRAGLECINERPSIGIAALRRFSRSQGRALGATGLAFTLAPRINAAGRMQHANDALELLLCAEEEKAERLAQRLELLNEERQAVERQIAEEALAWMEAQPQRRHDRVMVFAGEGWHEGVIGIVASRLVERYGKPCLVLSVRDGIAKGSGRSLPGFSLFEAVSRSAPLMQKFGGHAMAAGFTLAAADVERFREEINAYAAEQEMPFPSLQFDARLDPASLGPELCDEIALLEPFGAGNTQPLFMLRDVELVAATPISGGKHLRLTLRHGEGTLTAMRFHQSREEFCFSPGDCVDAAVMLEPNEYMGQRGVSVIVRELKYSRLPNDALLAAQRLTENVLRGEVLEPALADRCRPDREAVVKIYRTLQKGKLMLPEAVFLAIGADFLRQADAAALARLWIAAEVLCELGLAAVDGIGRMGLTAPAQKVNLEDSTLLRRLAREVGSTA